MPRPLLYPERSIARFVLGTLARIKAALVKGESQGDFVRAAVERELQRREGPPSRPTPRRKA